MTLAAHPDDVEIGCGGLLLQLARRQPALHVHQVVFSGTPQRAAEARAASALFLAGAVVELDSYDLPDGRFPAYWSVAKDLLEETAQRVPVDLVLAPSVSDAHQDHRTVAELVPTVWRDQLVLGYEIPKYDGDVGRPVVYVPMDQQVAARKVALLRECFPSQADRHWFEDELFLGLARIRGMECRHAYAEAFTCTKLTLGLG